MMESKLFKMEEKNKFCAILLKFSLIYITICLLYLQPVYGKDKGDDKYASLKKKNVVDYNEADMARLLQQWEEGEEYDDDELPEWEQPRPKIDLSSFDADDPESMLKMTKKGQTLMMFVTVSGNPTEAETEQITLLWSTSLFNANYELQRYIVGSNRALLTLKDGAKAWEIKDYLIQQERCELVTIEGKDYYGKGSENYEEPALKQPKKKVPSQPQKENTKSKEGNKKKKDKKNNEVKFEHEDL